MSVTTVVRPDTYHEDVSTALRQFIETYFDGLSHFVGKESLDVPVAVYFPHATVGAKRPLIEGLAYPFFVLTETGIVKGKRGRHTNGSYAERWSEWHIDLFVPSHLSQTVNGTVLTGSRLHDRCSSLMDLILENCGWVLSASGVHIVSSAGGVPVTDKDHEFEISTRTVRLRVSLKLWSAAFQATAPLELEVIS